MKLDNPFLIRGYAGPSYFCDRTEETQKLVSAISNGRDVTLVAPRRYGKTGLIHNAFQILDKTHATVYLDIFAIEDLTTFVQTFAAAVLDRLDSPAERIGRKLLTFFKSCRPTLTPKDDGSFVFSFDLAPNQAKATLKDLFDYIASRKRKVVIAIDEFQQIREFPEKGTEALLRSYIQFVPNAHFIFAGSRKHMMDAMFVSPKGPFYQSTQLMELSTIDSGKYAEFAAGFFLHDRRTFSNEAFHHLYERFDGITWYIQSILNRVWTHGGGFDSAQQVDDTVEDLVAESESFYFDLLRSQTSAEQSILKAVGREGVVKSISGGDFISRNKLPAASTIRSAAAKLTERDLLCRSEAGYVVYDRFFGLWLKRLNACK
ncbi:MAG: ATP-binding protein [Kiritimatiellae bacterium]|nr:ATP-binding protein [Kiritimatiellia bacterium]MBR6586121.1 ATP-binding protein [Kiritimatiellia bacterium]